MGIAKVALWDGLMPATQSRLASLDKRHLWHPFTQQTEWAEREPLIIKSGQGVWLRDANGRRLLDGVSSLWVNVWGHRRRELDQAIIRQLRRIAHSTFLGSTHEPAIRLAERLVDLAPRSLSRVFFSDNGSTAVEVAVKMAYQYWQLKGRMEKNKFVSLENGYHGDTVGAVSVGGVKLFHRRFEKLLFKGWQVKAPSVRRGSKFRSQKMKGKVERCSDICGASIKIGTRRCQMASVLERHHRRIAAVVMEPLVQGAAGMRIMPAGYLAHVAALCKRSGVLLIVDEVATGFGRTGTMFAVEQEGVSPDFLCVAKSLTGGYLPLAATLTTEAVFKAYLGRYDEFKTFFHGHTYTANPLACAVALANLELYRRHGLLRNVRARAAQLKAGLDRFADHPHVKAVRQAGLMCGIELALDRAGGLDYPPGQRVGLKVCDAAIRRGLWLRPLGDVLVLMPPLVISEKEMRFLLNVVEESINEVTMSGEGKELPNRKTKNQESKTDNARAR